VNCPIVSDASFSSGDRLFHADGPAAEKLRGPKPTVLVLGVAKSQHAWTINVGCVDTINDFATVNASKQSVFYICNQEIFLLDNVYKHI